MPDLFIFLCNVLLLIILSGFFSSSETALTAVSEARIHELALQGNKRALTIEKILAKKEKMISTILIGNNLVNIVASVYATSFAINREFLIEFYPIRRFHKMTIHSNAHCVLYQPSFDSGAKERNRERIVTEKPMYRLDTNPSHILSKHRRNDIPEALKLSCRELDSIPKIRPCCTKQLAM